MSRVTLLLSKDPVHQRGGDVAMTRLLVELAADAFTLDAICLSTHTSDRPLRVGAHRIPVTRVPKPAVAPAALARRSLRHRRSLVHVRFDTPALRAAVERHETGTFLAEHSYMAESLLHSASTVPLVVNTHVSEADVWSRRGLLGRVETGRLLRDELRVARAAVAVGTFDATEADRYRRHGVPGARWLDLTLPPAPRVDVRATPPRLLLMGTRSFPPNQEAFLEALRLWPRISTGVDGAELYVVGPADPQARPPTLPDGVRDLGFVEDLDHLLAGCRAMFAPVRTGGGVRVKILDAVRRGLPVAGTRPAVGSLDGVFALAGAVDDDVLVAQARRLLLDPDAAAREGARLHEQNAERWHARVPHRAVESLLRGEPPPGAQRRPG